jgi:hypothetical protein
MKEVLEGRATFQPTMTKNSGFESSCVQQATGRKPALGFRWRTAEMDSHFRPGTLAVVLSARRGAAGKAVHAVNWRGTGNDAPLIDETRRRARAHRDGWWR